MKSYMETVIENLYNELQQKKDNLIKTKLIEKGFEKYAENYGNERFPRVCCERNNGWSYYYADDGSQQGCFIVGIKDFEIKNPCDANVMTVTFKYADTLNAII